MFIKERSRRDIYLFNLAEVDPLSLSFDLVVSSAKEE